MSALDPELVSEERSRLTDRVASAIRASSDPARAAEVGWDRLAMEVFAFQVSAIPAYGRWCESRGCRPTQLTRPGQIPAVPTEAFKHLSLFAGAPASVAHTFRTSGTSHETSRGVAHFSSAGLALMDVSIDVRAGQMLFPDGRATRILALAPSPESDPDRIMAHGIRRLVETFGLDGSGFFVGAAGLDVAGILGALTSSAKTGEPVTLAGATSALVAVLVELERNGGCVRLPAGSRVMHAGGSKRGSRPVEPAMLDRMLLERLAIPSSLCVNLLGMTELASQLYDQRLAAHMAGRTPVPGKVAPPWARTWVVDPDHGDPVPVGEVGLLRHLDLANVERPLCVQTDDLGIALPDGSFEILGRASGAEARGCAVDLDEWRAAASAP